MLFIRLLRWKFGLIFRCLPPAAAVFCLHISAEFFYRLVRLTPVKKMVNNNLQLLLPQKETSLLADKLLKNISYSIFEIICTPFFRATHLDLIMTVHGLEYVDQALAAGKGALLMSMHSGNYEMSGTYLGIHGYKQTAILKAPPGDPLFRFVNEGRAHFGTKLVNIMEANMYRETLKALANNEGICYLIDTGALEGRHEKISFLGHQVPVATGWLALAERSGARVVLSTSKREGRKIVLTFSPPITVDADNHEAVIRDVSRHYENFIQHHPEQWWIFLNSHEIKRMLEGK
ncbi:hypothetical protein A2311_02175 [candidate division WOR-1 bacterium RIFOXYB2_FULL_48_7]|uniref:Lipid A biosynthesis acyltransferase n=1 Tax=candidate division WOR-1 bacterium RIFOXYB2_FULL_48_7 TaxID=1802583 RepID=A0A1F4TKQ7_UNCSA|nr:MAG: hypothetical protein A2311_02175 [candidate division WOR-1 bacterium RIFOXYB2_FULL_48_7]